MFFNLEYILIGKQKINAILGLHCISETFSPSSMLYTLIVESKELEAKPSNKNYLLENIFNVLTINEMRCSDNLGLCTIIKCNLPKIKLVILKNLIKNN